MVEILKKIGDLHDSLVDKHKKMDSVAFDQAELSSRLLEKASELSARESMLEAREGAVKEVENAIQLKKDAEALMGQAMEDMSALKEEKIKWHKEKSIAEQHLSNERALIAQSSKNNEENKKKIDDLVAQRVSEFLKKVK
jgi:hypothetical protein